MRVQLGRIDSTNGAFLRWDYFGVVEPAICEENGADRPIWLMVACNDPLMADPGFDRRFEAEVQADPNGVEYWRHLKHGEELVIKRVVHRGVAK